MRPRQGWAAVRVSQTGGDVLSGGLPPRQVEVPESSPIVPRTQYISAILGCT